ncbi:hypothetical protein BOTNAR_0030g00220 [Botryotinia narcissicola]|uniref:BTB domain-containing protein n=1 Tax=Botryotinia narcissicola TaxID=278944 RepID=A0A4Z1J989_9HELO|nr:hypothetical protein BOTNAR_0030g00220 [Botryotinia narcissicola]
MTSMTGKEKQKFTLHKQLLCESVEYFRAAFSAGGFRESQTSSMDMPEDDPEAFELFIHWLYRGEVRRAAKVTDIDQFLQLYIFAEKLCLKELANKTMDEIQSISGDLNEFPQCSLEQLDGVWRNTSSTSPLRKWLILVLVYSVWVSENGGLSTAEKKTFSLDTEKIISLWQLFKDYEDLYASFFTQLYKHTADHPPPCANNYSHWRPCAFHRHSEGEVCHFKTA